MSQRVLSALANLRTVGYAGIWVLSAGCCDQTIALMSKQQLCLATHFRGIKDLTTGYRF